MIAAPEEASEVLWALPPQQFNAWRAKYDFPRIVGFLKRYYPEFGRWQDSQGLDDQTLCDFGLARFLRPRVLYEYVFPDDPQRSPAGRHFWYADIDPALRSDVRSKKALTPYLLWAERERIPLSRDMRALGLGITGWFGKYGSEIMRASVFREVELLWIGGQTLVDCQLNERNLEFCSIDGVVLEGNVWNSNEIHLIGTSARKIAVRARLAFLDAYQSSFEDIVIERARLQDWNFEKCSVTGYIDSSTLFRCRVKKSDFNPVISNTDFNECSFDYEAGTAHEVAPAQQFHGFIMRQLSTCGRLAEAGEHSYRKKKLEIRMHFSPVYYFAKEFPPKRVYSGSFSDLIGDRKKGYWDAKKFWELFAALLKYHLSLLWKPRLLLQIAKHWTIAFMLTLSWLAWGFGERPWRVLLNSGVVLVGCAFLYLFFGVLETRGHIGGSLYFSIVSFATLGYGDIVQTGWLRFVSAAEAMMGVLALGLLVSSLASRSRY